MTFRILTHFTDKCDDPKDPPAAQGDGIVWNDNTGTLIDTSYTGDPEGDMVDNDDALLEGEVGDDDIIYANGGDDVILAGDGDDEIYAGSGDDYVEGGAGNDVIYGDSSSRDEDDEGTREVFQWSEATGFGDGANVGSFMQDTGSVKVYFTILSESSATDSTFSTSLQNVDDLDGDGEPVDRDSAFASQTMGKGETGEYGLAFSNSVEDVTFRINDVDGDGVVTITAYDADGNEVEVILDGGAGLTLSDTDSVPGADTAESDGGYADETSACYSVLVTIPGPVAKIVIDHAQDGQAYSGITVTDVYFSTTGDHGDVYDTGPDGDDTLLGGEGDDIIYGEGGNDTLDGGTGTDNMYGGDDRDLFINVNPGDHVDGNEGGDDWDTLDLRGSAPDGGSLKVFKDEDNTENGYVEFFDENGDSTGTMKFYNIEDVVPCFTPGTLIATPKGEVPVELLQEGDKVITRDNGIQEIRWMGKKTMDWQALSRASHLKPVLIKAGSLGNGLPERDMMVSPNHRMLVSNDRTALYFDEREVLASAKHLVDSAGIRSVDVKEVTYVHFLFDRHEVVLSDGTWSESFQPGDYSLKGVGNAQRQELFELFPELETRKGLEDFTAARRILKKHEALMLRS